MAAFQVGNLLSQLLDYKQKYSSAGSSGRCFKLK